MQPYPLFLTFEEQTAKRELLKMFSEQQQPPDGFPIAQRERFHWRRCFAVVLCAVSATLLLGRMLEQQTEKPIAIPEYLGEGARDPNLDNENDATHEPFLNHSHKSTNTYNI